MSSTITRRLATVGTASGPSSSRKIVLVGAGFLGGYIARALIADPRNRVVLVSRNPKPLHDRLAHLGSQILPPISADISLPSSVSALEGALEGAGAVVSLAGLLSASASQMKAVQEDGAARVAQAAKAQGVGRMVMVSAIGAEATGVTPYQRTKAAGEEAFLRASPTATIIRPSIVFAPGDSFFSRFATMARYMPFLPVFGGGITRFQPVYAGDVARLVEICCRDDPRVVEQVGGKIIEAGGPEIFTYREIMQMTLDHAHLRRPILSLPFWLGKVQAFFLEKLPTNLFTVTRDQVEQLKSDNIVSPVPPIGSVNFQDLLRAFPSSLPSSTPPQGADLVRVGSVLPTYLGPKEQRQEGKRTHGRGAGTGVEAFEEVRRMSGKST